MSLVRRRPRWEAHCLPLRVQFRVLDSLEAVRIQGLPNLGRPWHRDAGAGGPPIRPVGAPALSQGSYGLGLAISTS